MEIIKSLYEPSNRNVIWLDLSLNPPVFKEYGPNGWEIVNDTKELKEAIKKLQETDVTSLNYDEDLQQIQLIDADGNVLSYIDATRFVVDGMLDDVDIDEENHTVTLIFNVDAGKKPIVISYDDIYDQMIQTAKEYTDSKAAETLASANAYTDSAIEKVDSEIGNVYTKSEVDSLLDNKLDSDTAATTYATKTELTAHTSDTDNPHQVTKDQVGLGNVDNTSDLNKPISTAVQEALNLKANQATTYTKDEVNALVSSNSAVVIDVSSDPKPNNKTAFDALTANPSLVVVAKYNNDVYKVLTNVSIDAQEIVGSYYSNSVYNKHLLISAETITISSDGTTTVNTTQSQSSLIPSIIITSSDAANSSNKEAYDNLVQTFTDRTITSVYYKGADNGPLKLINWQSDYVKTDDSGTYITLSYSENNTSGDNRTGSSTIYLYSDGKCVVDDKYAILATKESVDKITPIVLSVSATANTTNAQAYTRLQENNSIPCYIATAQSSPNSGGEDYRLAVATNGDNSTSDGLVYLRSFYKDSNNSIHEVQYTLDNSGIVTLTQDIELLDVKFKETENAVRTYNTASTVNWENGWYRIIESSSPIVGTLVWAESWTTGSPVHFTLDFTTPPHDTFYGEQWTNSIKASITSWCNAYTSKMTRIRLGVTEVDNVSTYFLDVYTNSNNNIKLSFVGRNIYSGSSFNWVMAPAPTTGIPSTDGYTSDGATGVKYFDTDKIKVVNAEELSNVNIEDLVSYGVQWQGSASNPDCTRIGNLSLHKTLPIQNSMRGCVVKGTEVQYYLDANDWSKKEDGTAAVLDGTDGDVMVEIPSFYIKSGIDGLYNWVKISTQFIDSSWTKVPKMYISAYRVTTDRTDTSSIKLMSVVNNTANFIGGNGGNTDNTLDYKSDYGKPRTLMTRETARTYAHNKADGTELLYYNAYYPALYWLPVIEYATFNMQQAFNDELTSEGYHQGGLGPGVTNVGSYLWSAFNRYYPLVPCGYTNDLGNQSGVKTISFSEFDYTSSGSVNWSNWSHSSDTSVAHTYSGSEMTITNVASNTYVAYCGFTTAGNNMQFTVAGLTEGQGLRFTCSGMEEVTITTNGQFTINWPVNTNTRYIYFTFTGACNITLTIDSNAATEYTGIKISDQSVCRYRGIEQIYGDIWTNLDGIVIDPTNKATGYVDVYATSNPDNFTDLTTDKDLIGKEVYQNGYIKSFDLGEKANIIPYAVGGGSTTYKCDYHYVESGYGLRTLLVGGRANIGALAGLGYWYAHLGVASSFATVGFRTINVVKE